MNAAVVDASALVAVLLRHPYAALRRRLHTSEFAAPEFVDLEVLQALRRESRAGRLSDDEAGLLLVQLDALPVVRAPCRALLGRVWELRHSITAYDAAYIALAERLGVPLVTCDAKLAGSNGHGAKIELYPRGQESD